MGGAAAAPTAHGASSAELSRAQPELSPSCAELSPELRRAHASSGDDVDARAAVAEVRVVRLHDLGLREIVGSSE